MRRRKTGGKTGKAQRHKTLTRRNAPKAARHRSPLTTSKETDVARLTRERRRAEERFHLAVEAAPSGMIMIMADSEGRIILLNAYTEKLLATAVMN